MLDLEIMTFWKPVFRYGYYPELAVVAAEAVAAVAFDGEGGNLVVEVAFDSDDHNKPVAVVVAYNIVVVVARNTAVEWGPWDILPGVRRDEEAVLACMDLFHWVQNFHLARVLDNTCSKDDVAVVPAE